MQTFEIERNFDNFDQSLKLEQIYQIGVPIVERLMYISVKEWTKYDLAIAKVALAFTKTFEECDKLAKIAFSTSKNLQISDKITYKLDFYMQILNRMVKADFFEIDLIGEEDRSKKLKVIFE